MGQISYPFISHNKLYGVSKIQMQCKPPIPKSITINIPSNPMESNHCTKNVELGDLGAGGSIGVCGGSLDFLENKLQRLKYPLLGLCNDADADAGPGPTPGLPGAGPDRPNPPVPGVTRPPPGVTRPAPL